MGFNVVFRGQVFGAELAALAHRKGFRYAHVPDDDALFGALPEADVLWITPSCYQPSVARRLMDDPHRLKWLALTSGGYDVLIRLGAPQGVQLTYATGVHAPTVAEHSIAQLLCLLRQFPAALRAQKDERWAPAPLIPTLHALEDLDVCIVGLGPIGQQLAVKLKALARSVVGINLTGRPVGDLVVHKLADVDRVIPDADVVFIATPLTDETRNLFDRRRLGLMRRGAYLVNLARGANVETTALIDALQTGALAGAALDVTDPEPLPEKHPLWNAPNLLITPHVAAFGSVATGARLADHLDRNLQKLATGAQLEGLISL